MNRMLLETFVPVPWTNTVSNVFVFVFVRVSQKHNSPLENRRAFEERR